MNYFLMCPYDLTLSYPDLNLIRKNGDDLLIFILIITHTIEACPPLHPENPLAGTTHRNDANFMYIF